jgi:RNA polymerase-binding transcription factor DksA
MAKKVKAKSKATSPKKKSTKVSAPKKTLVKKAKSAAPVAKKSKSATVDSSKNGVQKVVLSTLPKAFLQSQRSKLLELRDHLLDQMQGVAQDNLRSRAEGSEGSAFGMHQADAGSDAYEKDFALSLLSQEQDALYEIEEALKRIDQGTYGVCEMSQKTIPKNRLEAIPFARFTVECQTQLEKENKGRRRWDTSPVFMDSSELSEDDEEAPSDDEEKRKEKE